MPHFERSLCPGSSCPDTPGSTQLKPCHPLGMSGDAEELPGSAFGSTERGKARRLLLGISTLFLTVTLGSLSNRVPGGPLPLPFDTLILALVIGSVILTRSRPQESGRALIPRNLRSIARIAGLPELATTLVVYTCVIAGLTVPVVGLIVSIVTN
jgi:membrane protease YdiL (CAAX protease family)